MPICLESAILLTMTIGVNWGGLNFDNPCVGANRIRFQGSNLSLAPRCLCLRVLGTPLSICIATKLNHFINNPKKIDSASEQLPLKLYHLLNLLIIRYDILSRHDTNCSRLIWWLLASTCRCPAVQHNCDYQVEDIGNPHSY